MKRHLVLCALSCMAVFFIICWVRSTFIQDNILLLRSTGRSASVSTLSGVFIFRHYTFTEGTSPRYFGPRARWTTGRPRGDDLALMNWVWETGGFYVNLKQQVVSNPGFVPVAKLDEIVVPMWVLIVLGSAYPVWKLVSALRTRHYRIANGLCPRCGFELLDGEEECPECGRSVGREAFA
jgi:hypothetical protein